MMEGLYQILAHLVGDYVIQNHWMGVRKTEQWLPAVVHAVLYTAAFALFFGFCWALAIIGSTHLIIDRYSLIKRYWVDFWGIGKMGRIMPRLGAQHIDDAPPFIGVWLAFIADNVVHLLINTAALHYLG